MLPPVDTSLFPPDVRKAGPEAEKLYSAALQFESLLTSQITQQMFDSAQSLGGSGSDGTDSTDNSDGSDSTSVSTSNPYQSMLPSALSDSLTAAGGLGLAPELYRSFGGAYLQPPGSSGGSTGSAAGGTTAASGSASGGGAA